MGKARAVLEIEGSCSKLYGGLGRSCRSVPSPRVADLKLKYYLSSEIIETMMSVQKSLY